MKKIAAAITRHHKKIFFAFLILSAISAVLLFKHKVNYSLTSYLPDDVESTVALDIMENEFTSGVPNARVVLPDLTMAEALEAKNKLLSVDGVTSVLWLDDIADVKKPLPFIDKALLNEYYKDGVAQFTVTIKDGKELAASDKIRELLGEGVMLSGIAIQNAYYQRQVLKEVIPAVAIILPVGLFVLLLTTSSWILPLVLLLAVGVAVLANMGFSALFGPMSFITQATAPILQLAVSLDYLIFLLNSFERKRKVYGDVYTAMQKAITESSTAIAASALTTIFGFLALMFMRFGVGTDLGLNLAKGIIFSYICSIVFLPSVILLCLKGIDKFRHKQILPEFPNIGSKLLKIRIPLLILAVLLVIPSFIGKDKTDFMYGNGSPGHKHRFYQETQKINELFGENTAIVIVSPKGDLGKEAQLVSELQKIPHVNSVVSYVTAVGAQIPDVLVPSDSLALLQSEKYSRIILTTDTGEEGPGAFETVDAVRATCGKYFDRYWVCGQSANLRDMKTVIRSDSRFVNGIAIGFVFLTLLFSFKSLILPFILLFVIESAIWINLAIPYFQGSSLVYLGYLVISTVQLGATIDYAILVTDGYMSARKTMSAYDASKSSLNSHFISVFTSAVILTSAGFALNISSSMSVVIALGRLLGIGTILSFCMVIFVLPALLIIFDPLTQKLTLKRPLFGARKEAEPEPVFAVAAPAHAEPAGAAVFVGLFKKKSAARPPVSEPEPAPETVSGPERKSEATEFHLPAENASPEDKKTRHNIVYVEDGEDLKAMTAEALRPPKLYYLDRSDIDTYFAKEEDEEDDFEEAYMKEMSAFVKNISSELSLIREETARQRTQNEELKEELRRLKNKNRASSRRDELLREIRKLNAQMSTLKAEIGRDNSKLSEPKDNCGSGKH